MKPRPLAAFRSANRARPQDASALLETRVQRCQHIIGYRFNDQQLIREALTTRHSTNQRLAIAGDKVADTHLATHWYRSSGSHRDPLTPTQWHVIRQDLLRNTNLAKAGFRLGLLDGGNMPCGGPTMATAVEAVIGAVWLDSKGHPAALATVMQAFGLTTHPLLPSPPAHKPDIPSNRPLPRRFFNGHHLPLLQLLVNHGHFFALRQQTAPRSHLSPYDHKRRGSGADTLLAGMWSRLKSILSTPKIAVDTPQESVAARTKRKHDHHAREPRPRRSTKAPGLQASAPVPATNQQTAPDHSGATLISPPPIQQPVVQSGSGDSLAGSRGRFAGWYPWDTEYKRLKCFIYAVSEDEERSPSDKKRLLRRLNGHLRALPMLPDGSPKITSNGRLTGRVFLTTHSADEHRDKVWASQIGLLAPVMKRLNRRRWRARRGPAEDSIRHRTRAQLMKLWSKRLDLWLPPDAQASQFPTSLPDKGPNSASPSKAPSSRLPVTPAVDSMESLPALPPGDQRPDRPDSVLWTTNVAQRKSVDWKHHLSKPTTAHEEIMQSGSRKL